MVEISTIPRPPKTMFEVFVNLPEGTLAQLINNQLVMSPGPSFTHQKISGELFGNIFLHLKKNPVGIVLAAPFDVYLERFEGKFTKIYHKDGEHDSSQIDRYENKEIKTLYISNTDKNTYGNFLCKAID